MGYVFFTASAVLVWLAVRAFRKPNGVPWHKAARGFALISFAVLSAVVGLILIIPASDKASDVTAAVGSGSPSTSSQPSVPVVAAAPVQEVGFDWNAVQAAMHRDLPEAMAAFHDKGVGTVEVEKNTRKETRLTIWLAKRSDGVAARHLAETFAKYVLKDRVARGQVPSKEGQSLHVHVQSRDAPESVTGRKQTVWFGQVSYDPFRDRLEWSNKLLFE